MIKKITTVLFLLLWIISAINPLNFKVWFIENLLVILIFPVILWLDKKYEFSNFAYVTLAIYVGLHLIGAHFTYAKMNDYDIAVTILGINFTYDKWVHFLFGFFVFIPFYEIFLKLGNSKIYSYFTAFLMIISISALYEIGEWVVVASYHAETGASKFVTHGDEWDAQKDMAYAIIGAVIAYILHKIKVFR